VRARRLAAVAAALAVVTATLADAALTPAAVLHERPAAVLVVAAVLSVALLGLAPRVPSWAVALGAGVAAGGAAATAVGGFAWGGVPDPLVHAGVAFNLADVAIAVGDMLLFAGALAHAWSNRHRLGAHA
jgi:lipoprotein signal peptidase